eukprot:scaffold58698_cov70-Phaeocystis_antarctica.AAC.6
MIAVPHLASQDLTLLGRHGEVRKVAHYRARPVVSCVSVQGSKYVRPIEPRPVLHCAWFALSCHTATILSSVRAGRCRSLAPTSGKSRHTH